MAGCLHDSMGGSSAVVPLRYRATAFDIRVWQDGTMRSFFNQSPRPFFASTCGTRMSGTWVTETVCTSCLAQKSELSNDQRNEALLVPALRFSQRRSYGFAVHRMRKPELLGLDRISIQLGLDALANVCRKGRQDRRQRHRTKVQGKTVEFTRVHRVNRDRVLAGPAKGIESPDRQAVETVFDAWAVMSVALQSTSVVRSHRHVACPGILPSSPLVHCPPPVFQTD